jgi:hypothetical protein
MAVQNPGGALVGALPGAPKAAESEVKREPVLSPGQLGRLYRGLWALCVLVYLGVFFGGLAAGGTDVWAMVRAMVACVAVALVGRLAIGLLGQATQAVEQAPLAAEEGTLGSLIDLVSSPNVRSPGQDAPAGSDAPSRAS